MSGELIGFRNILVPETFRGGARGRLFGKGHLWPRGTASFARPLPPSAAGRLWHYPPDHRPTKGVENDRSTKLSSSAPAIAGPKAHAQDWPPTRPLPPSHMRLPCAASCINFSSMAAGRCTRLRKLRPPSRWTSTRSGAGGWSCRYRWDRNPSRPRGRLLRSGLRHGCRRCRRQAADGWTDRTKLREALVAPVGNRPAGCRPGKNRLAVFDVHHREPELPSDG